MQLVRSIMPGIVMVIVSLIFLSQAIVMEKADIMNPAEGNFFPALISVIMLLCGLTVIAQQFIVKYREQTSENKDTSSNKIFMVICLL